MAVYDKEKVCVCALNLLFGYKPSVSRTLISELGSARAVFELKDGEKSEIFGPYSGVKDKIGREALSAAEAELQAAERMGCAFIPYYEPGYPPLLAECEDRPVGLYYKGRLPPEELFSARDFISVVGTRDISEYGKNWCRNLVSGLAQTGSEPVVVSGFAFGTDMAAHRAAVENGLFTLGVLPSGLDTVYPRYHGNFAKKIVSEGRGALVSDYPFGTTVQKVNFVRRNRIIAGISRATVLIESRIKGGGLITCKHAFSYDREVYALPGRADDIRSAGCNMLIRSEMAVPIISAENLLGSLGLHKKAKSAGKLDFTAIFSGRLAPEQIGAVEKIYLTVKERVRAGTEELALATGLSFPELSALTAVMGAEGLLDIGMSGICSLKEKN